MSMTLEQVIADCEEEISDCQIDLDGIAKLLEEYPERKEAFAHEIDDYKKRMDYNRQLAEWLKELVERRKLPKIIRCKDCKHLYNLIRGNQGVCQTFNGFSSLVKFDEYCSKAERRTDEAD